MRPEYRDLRVRQLSKNLSAFYDARNIPRPQRGWLRAFREALGLTVEEIGRKAHMSRGNVQFFEKAESRDRITLRSLRRIADAMGCELVYALVPKSGTIAELAEAKTRDDATKRVLSVEHSMALENQAVGNTKELIDEETKRLSKKR